jgi:uroporphyrinogen-III synthase
MAASGTLSGRYIVVTRPAAQAEALCDAIASRGGTPLRFPLLAIAAPHDTTEMAAATDQLGGFDLAFFVSPNAVRLALEFILPRRNWPAHVAVATVGKGSERELNSYGFKDVIAPQSGFDSEAVLALKPFQPAEIVGKRVVIFRGDGGRDLLGATLRERGAEVVYATCYRRYRPELDATPLIERAKRGALDAITMTSSEGVPNLVVLLGKNGMEALRDVPMFAPHPRIAGIATAAGFASVHVTESGDVGLMRALESYFVA